MLSLLGQKGLWIFFLKNVKKILLGRCHGDPFTKRKCICEGSTELPWRQGAPSRGVATGTSQERGDKMDARYCNVAKRRGVWSLRVHV